MTGQFSNKLKVVILVLIVGFAFLAGAVVQSSLSQKNSQSHLVTSPSPTAINSPQLESTRETNESTSASDVLGDTVVLDSETPEASNSLDVKPSNNEAKRQKVKVVKVVDGDTIEIEGGMKIRYIGIDTPETVKPNTPVQCFGKDASNKNKELVDGKEIEIEKDVSETDRYGRLLRYVYVGEVFVNQYLVSEGFAYASTYPPDIKYQEVFKEAQKAAQEAKRGLWGSCSVDPKKVISESNTVLGSSVVNGESSNDSTPQATIETVSAPHNTSRSNCTIKGNISSSGKIYHLPGCGSYEKTTINEVQGERWFCSEEEAVAAGWRKAKNC